MSENTKPSKGEQSRLNILYIIFTLKKYSNEQHPLSVNEITKHINRDYAHFSTMEQLISPDTVKRTLDMLTSYFFDTSEPEISKIIADYGFIIFCVMKENDAFVTYHSSDDTNARKKYYYYQSCFTNAEVTTLIDAIETYNYFSDDDLLELIDKLIKIQPVSYASEQYHNYVPSVKDKNSIVSLNINSLDQIIDRKHCAKITYCNYNEKKELVLRPGYPKKIDPIALMWSNGYYYLVAYHPEHKTVVNYRIDRSTDVEEIEETPSYTIPNFSPSNYKLEHPVMYGGDCVHMALLCRETGSNYIMNSIMDTFGVPAKIRPATNEELIQYLNHDSSFYQERGEKWFHISFRSSTKGVELWALQYCDNCVIISPQESILNIKAALAKANELYSHLP